MSGASDLARLVALRSLKEERAKAAMIIANTRLHETSRVLWEAEAAIGAHELAMDQRERRLFEAMSMNPISENELGRTRDRLRVSDQSREVLIAKRSEAAKAAEECDRQLIFARETWRRRLIEHERLCDALDRLRVADLATAEAASEQETEEIGMNRAHLP